MRGLNLKMSYDDKNNVNAHPGEVSFACEFSLSYFKFNLPQTKLLSWPGPVLVGQQIFNATNAIKHHNISPISLL